MKRLGSARPFWSAAQIVFSPFPRKPLVRLHQTPKMTCSVLLRHPHQPCLCVGRPGEAFRNGWLRGSESLDRFVWYKRILRKPLASNVRTSRDVAKSVPVSDLLTYFPFHARRLRDDSRFYKNHLIYSACVRYNHDTSLSFHRPE